MKQFHFQWHARSFLVFLLIAISINACNKNEGGGPYDNVPPDTWAPGDFRMTVNSTTSITLHWTDRSEWEEGFKIDRKANQDSWEVPRAVLPSDATSYTDDGVDLDSNQYAYKIYAYLGDKESTSLEISTPPPCGTGFEVFHTGGKIAPESKTVTYGTVEIELNGSKKCWITKNLGAERQANNHHDDAEASAGWYWQFNLKQGFKHDGTARKPNTPWKWTINENSDWQLINDPCALLLGTGWRLPTHSEWVYLIQDIGWDDPVQAYESPLKLHKAGILDPYTGDLMHRGKFGEYWSGTQWGGSFGYSFHIGFSFCYTDYESKTWGKSVRCLRDW